MSWLFELHAFFDKIYDTNPTLITLGVIALFLVLFLSSRTLSRTKVTTIAMPLLVMAMILGIAALYFGAAP